MKKIIFTIILSLVFIKLKSQNYVDLISCGYSQSFPAGYEDNKGKINLKSYHLDFKIPLVLNKNNVLLLGLSSTKYTFDLEQPKYRTINVYRELLQIGHIKKWNEKLKTTFVILPRFNSDANSLDKQNFQFGGLALFSFQLKNNFILKTGLYYNDELYGDFFVPLLGLDWNISEKLQFFGTLPISANISYYLNKKLTTGLFFRTPSNSFAIENNNQKEYLTLESNEIFTFLDFYITKNIVLNVKFGRSIGRSSQIFQDNDCFKLKIWSFKIDDNRNALSPDIKDCWLFEMRIIFRFQT